MLSFRRSAAFAILLPLALRAQEEPVFHTEVNLVTVPCVVSDQTGAAVTGLGREDFRLYDNGVRQEIQNLWLDKDLPLALGVIVDVSESQRHLIREHRAAVDQFLERMLRPQDRAFVVEVNQDVVLRSEVIGAERGLRQIVLAQGGEPLGEPCPKLRGRSLCGGTALWNAVYASAHLKLRSLKGSKALLILSDGNDTGSTHSLDQAVEESQRSESTVYAIRYPDPRAAPGIDGLSRLTGATGGMVFDPPGAGYGDILSQIEAELRSRYILGFQSAQITGTARHQLKLEVTRPGLTIRSRKEYFEYKDSRND